MLRARASLFVSAKTSRAFVIVGTIDSSSLALSGPPTCYQLSPSMSERFFSSNPITAERITLDGPEAHHLLHVMRATPGERVILFDGTGAEFIAIVEQLRRSEVELRIAERCTVDRELPFPLTVGVALPKGDRQKWLVEKLTELGVTTLVPLITERSVAQPSSGALDRLRRAVIEAAKQCGRNRLMALSTPQRWTQWLDEVEHCPPNRNPQSDIRNQGRFVAHLSGRPLNDL